MKINTTFRYPVALTIAGSDSSGGAGIQADLKTFSALGVFGASAITSITAQNTQGVRGIQAISPEIVEGQIHAVFEDLTVDAVKIGMLHNRVPMLEMPDGATRFVQDGSILYFMEYYHISLMNPTVLIGLFIGAMMSFLFCGLTMNAVGRAAESMVQEVRRQFREIKGILTGEGTPDYARCVAISTRGAQREMLLPSLLAIIVPVVVGLIFGVAGVMGLLVGGLSSGFVLAVFMANAGGAWDNAKKMIEEGHFGGKGSDSHKATVVGDTVGDPFKDTSGPSLNILIKLMSMVSIVMAGLTVAWHLF